MGKGVKEGPDLSFFSGKLWAADRFSIANNVDFDQIDQHHPWLLKQATHIYLANKCPPSVIKALEVGAQRVPLNVNLR